MIEWSDQLRVGVPEIDAEHVELFAVCKRLNSAVSGNQDVSGGDLEFLGRYIDVHFAHEERLMRETAYPGIDEHLKEHARYRVALFGLLTRAAKNPSAMPDVALSVTTWLLYHIQQEDRALAAHLRAREEGQMTRSSA